MERQSQAKLLGRYIVADPKICHGKPTFRGTRIMVSQVLEQVARGMDWESITERWGGSITKEAIAEAVCLSNQAFLEHADEYLIYPTLTPQSLRAVFAFATEYMREEALFVLAPAGAA